MINRMSSKLQQLKHTIYSKLYREETGFLLNYLTLKIEDKEVASQLRNHRTE
jgi:hypothetical protein